MINIVEATAPALVPVITGAYQESDYDQVIFVLKKGDVFQFDEATISYETMAGQIGRYSYNAGIEFGFIYLEPGTILFSLHGPNTCLVTQNE